MSFTNESYLSKYKKKGGGGGHEVLMLKDFNHLPEV